MIIEWEMSIGYPTAKRTGEIEIDDEELEGMSEEERETFIHEAIWEDAVQYVDVYPTNI
jgi:hypothetical protein